MHPESARLVFEPLSRFRHYGAMRRMGSDAEVMRYIFGVVETPSDTAAWMAKVEQRWQTQGHAWWALLHANDIVGAATLQRLGGGDSAPFEIGWRLPRACQKKGYAREAAEAILQHAQRIGINEIYAVANPENLASRRVMEHIGMVDIGLQTHYGQSVATYRWTI